MLSMGTVRSAGGASTYFAADNYYTAEQSESESAWAGAGAEQGGLSGPVDRQTFEAVLNGKLPDGTQVGDPGTRRHGSDFTFSMPKSASLLAYLSGDQRLLAANMAAVKETMKWAEANLAEARVKVGGKDVAVRTGNLVYALFPHDTSRATDPQAHVHAIIANMTRLPEQYRNPDRVDPTTGEVTRDDGWRAWHNTAMWKANATLGSIYHAALRERVEALGYKTELTGKHGAFEIAGVNQESIVGFSKRREDIKAKADELGIKSREGMLAVTLRTRDAKLDAGDRDTLRGQWREEARQYGYNGDEIHAEAQARVAERPKPLRGVFAVHDAIKVAFQRIGHALKGPSDPLIDPRLSRTHKPEVAGAQYAVASAIRIHAEREAAFGVNDIVKTALDLGFAGVKVSHVEQRIDQLVERGQLVPGKSTRHDKVIESYTTPQAIAEEKRILAAMDAGRGRGRPLMDASTAAALLQELAGERPLNAEQLAAAVQIVSSPDRIVLVQGRAGAGKSTMLQPIAKADALDAASRLIETAGEKATVLIGEPSMRAQALAFQNKMIADLADTTGLSSNTVHSFIWRNERFLDGRTDRAAFAARRAELEGRYVILDEASMVSSEQMDKLTAIANRMALGRLVIMGDRKQLSAIERGKPDALLQAHAIQDGQPPAEVNINMRQKTELMRAVAELADRGEVRAAIALLGDKVVESPDRVEAAASSWLALSAEDRTRTTLLSAGREGRSRANEIIQQGLKAEGTLTGDGQSLQVRERVGLTHEELRHSQFWRQATVLEVGSERNDLGLARGDYRIALFYANGKVDVVGPDGRKHRIEPAKIRSEVRNSGLSLATEKEVMVHAGETIRWTANDKQRGLLNATIARVEKVEGGEVTVRLVNGESHVLGRGDSMLSRIDLAYAINTHMAQGITNHTVFSVMGSGERNLSNARAFLVNHTRQQYDVRLFTDDKEKLTCQLEGNRGDKTSALEAIGELPVQRVLERAEMLRNRESPKRPHLAEGLGVLAPGGSVGSRLELPDLGLPAHMVEAINAARAPAVPEKSEAPAVAPAPAAEPAPALPKDRERPDRSLGLEL